jgi:hypothetical protein
MRYFQMVQEVRLDTALVDKATRFAKEVVATTNYHDSRQLNKLKIEHDHFISKLGEEAVRLAFEKLGKKVVGPDYRVYQKKQKSWDADLFIDNVALAVKTQGAEAAKKYGLSWTFQAGSKRHDPILEKPDAWVCFVGLESNVLAEVYPPFQIKELKLREPKLARLKGSKLVVYVEDLLETTLT